MKKKYVLLGVTIGVEFELVAFFERRGITVTSWIGNVVGLLLFFLPILILLHLVSKDGALNVWLRWLCSGLFWLICSCYVICMISLFMENIGKL